MEDNDRVKSVKFEQLLHNPEKIITEICQFLGVEFDKKMLLVPNIGSSTELDKKNELKIDKTKIEKWKNGGLNNAEIYLSQLMGKDMMRKYNYSIKTFKIAPFFVFYYAVTFPLKSVLALLFNLKRLKNISEIIKQKLLLK